MCSNLRERFHGQHNISFFSNLLSPCSPTLPSLLFSPLSSPPFSLSLSLSLFLSCIWLRPTPTLTPSSLPHPDLLFLLLVFVHFYSIMFSYFHILFFLFFIFLIIRKHISKGGNHLLSGDARGFLKVWDTRAVANGPKAPTRANLTEPPDADERYRKRERGREAGERTRGGERGGRKGKEKRGEGLDWVLH